MSSINFVSLCESVIDEGLLFEARTENYKTIADQANQAREARQTTRDSEVKKQSQERLKELQTRFLGELNYGTRPENALRTNDELEAIIHEIALQGPVDLSGLNNLKPSVLGDVSTLAPRTQNNALFSIFKTLKQKGKNIYQILANKQKTGKYE